MTTFIAFDFKRKQVREKVEAGGRKRVISHATPALLNRPVKDVWRMWAHFSFKYVSYRNGVLILERQEIGNVTDAVGLLEAA